MEQILPTVATRADLEAAIAPLATRAEMREEGERARRHIDVVAESLRQDIGLIAEAQAASGVKIDALALELRRGLADHERRQTRLEARDRQR